MTSFRQIEANRRNAQKSTGPRSEHGKQRARRNAVRHGLTAETVIEPIEDAEDYKAFEQAVAADYDAQSAVERELILRLASLLWRLRRATSVETGLLQMEGEILRERMRQTQPKSQTALLVVELRQSATHVTANEGWSDRSSVPHALDNDLGADTDAHSAPPVPDIKFVVARCFLGLADLDNGVFERLGRYEAALWRQVRQTLFTLEGLRGRSFNTRYRGQQLWSYRSEALRD
jgi:hypothetical protein